VSACAGAGDLLGGGAGVGGQFLSLVQDAELGVFGGDGDDFAAVSVSDVEFGAGDHEGAAAGDDPLNVGDLGRQAGGRSGRPGAVQACALLVGERVGAGSGQDSVGDDVDELGVDAEGDASAGQGYADADLFAGDGDHAAVVDQPVDLNDCLGGQFPGREGSDGRRTAGPAAGVQLGQVVGCEGDRAGLDELVVVEDVQGGGADPDGRGLAGHGGAEPDSAEQCGMSCHGIPGIAWTSVIGKLIAFCGNSPQSQGSMSQDFATE
jgi:hypothetical protein